MKSRPAVLLLAIALTIALRGVANAQTEVSQTAVAERLLSNDSAEQLRALDTVRTIEPKGRGPALRTALITLLSRQNKEVREATGRRANRAAAESSSPSESGANGRGAQ